MMREFCLHLLCFAAVFNATSRAADHQVVYSDQNFFSEDWTTLVLVRDDPDVAGPPPLTSLGSVTRQTLGGNFNTPYMRSILNVVYGDIVNTTGIYVEESYDPRQGAISSLDFSYLVNHFNTPGNSIAGIALLQSGRLFIGSSEVFNGNLWVPQSGSGLNADDFVAVDFWYTGMVIRPDFSAFGDPIQFGYTLQNSNVVSGTSFTRARGMDNWSVTLNLAAMSDIHGDGVDSVDLDFWSAGYGTAGEALLVDGDFNLDTNVDGADFLKWQRQFGSGVPPLSAVTSVPEPSSLSIFSLLAVAGGCFRRHLSRHRSGHGDIR